MSTNKTLNYFKKLHCALLFCKIKITCVFMRLCCRASFLSLLSPFYFYDTIIDQIFNINYCK